MKHQGISQRQHRVAGLINAALIEVFYRGKSLDERLMNCPLTITRVDVSADLRIANCYFLPFNTTLKAPEIMEALTNCRYIIRDFVTKKINLKYSPEIRFHHDQRFDNTNKVEQLLKLISTEKQ